ncbi:hypothetical protein BCR35DRAFT_330622 [Leucosporidium creatinivorum]|uniref:Uncharacterized protein n=1 Tax=Leucosporidium creatinivorum TaxID=106004 RepID=A0A1Y2FTW9_9BASI|nr:hypothetical protein BCR35DRAFT_330622 [Leucosporidium creatinivorum]
MDALPDLLTIPFDYDPSSTTSLTPIQLALLRFHTSATPLHVVFAQAEFKRRREALLSLQKQEIQPLLPLLQTMWIQGLRVKGTCELLSKTVEEGVRRRKDVKAEDVEDWEGYVQRAVAMGFVKVIPAALESSNRRMSSSGPWLKTTSSLTDLAELKDPLPFGLTPEFLPLCWPLARYLAPLAAADIPKVSTARLVVIAFLSMDGPPLHDLCREWKTRKDGRQRHNLQLSFSAFSPTSIFPTAFQSTPLNSNNIQQSLSPIDLQQLVPPVSPLAAPTLSPSPSTSAAASGLPETNLDSLSAFTADESHLPPSLSSRLHTLHAKLPLASHSLITPRFVASLFPPPLRPDGIAVPTTTEDGSSTSTYFAYLAFDSATAAMDALGNVVEAKVERVDSQVVAWRWKQMLTGSRWAREAWFEDVKSRYERAGSRLHLTFE